MLSLCVIAKDEEHCIGQMLQSVKGVVDEVVLLDTGSSDATSSIAQSHGARIVPYHWTDSFADARNASLDQATHPWILVLDADEELAAHSGKEVRELIQGPPRGLFLNRRHLCASWTAAACTSVSVDDPAYTRGARTYFKTLDLRLFPNTSSVRYTGEVHESVEDNLKQSGYRVESTTIFVDHYGHLRPDEKKGDKLDLYLRLARRKAEQAPNDWRSWHHLGAEFQTQMRHHEAIESYNKALHFIQDFAPLWRDLGISRLGVGDVTGALAALAKSISIDPGNLLTWTILGAAFLELGHLDDAKNCYQTVLQGDPSNLAAQNQLAIIQTKKAERS